ncbi:MAG: hypothetical protein K9J79_02010 [Desulfobacteraceae bacterium]|nr:hypothetical protein [Desulfobacteraceae bacterium]
MGIEFEGPEKKLELILSEPDPELRSNADGRWDAVVHASGAEIVSSISSPEMDAYLLSESSLFVWDDRVLMITCGKTTLVKAVPELIRTLKQDRIGFFFYERKSLMYPNAQNADFEADVAGLAKHFTGKSYRLGPANYDHVHIFYASAPEKQGVPAPEEDEDETLELLMHELDPSVLKAFIPRAEESSADIEAQTGIDRLYPEMTNDSFVFKPYGYSMNRISGEHYVTIHVTPEESGSYASFETNAPEADYKDRIEQITEIFRPGRFTLVFTEAVSDRDPGEGKLPKKISGYRRPEKSLYEFDSGYAVLFSNFVKK